MKVNQYVLPGLVIVILLGTVGVAKATGQWIVSGKQLIDVTHLTSGADIKGWMTLQQVADGFGIEQEAFYRMLGIPGEVPPETALKEMETILPDFETSRVRDLVGAYLGGGGDVPGPQEASTQPDVLPTSESEGDRATATPLPIRTTDADHIPAGDGSGTGPTPVPGGEVLAGADIKGRHTLQEVVDQAQVSLPDLLAALNLPADIDPGTRVKDLVEGGQIVEVQVVRDAVTGLQGK